MAQAKHSGFTNGPWSVDSIKADGEYGNGGSDTHEGFNAYAVFDTDGRVLFDSLNRDSGASEIREEHDEYGTHAWDELARRDLTLAAAAPALYEALKAITEECNTATKYSVQSLRGDMNRITEIARAALSSVEGK